MGTVKSMTGYGKAVAAVDGGKVTVEIRSLNAKSADISVKSQILPKEHEMSVRKKLSERLLRGTIDLYVNFEADGAEVARPVNTELAKAYLRQMEDALGANDPATRATLMASILRLPDVVDTKKAEIITEATWPAVEKAIDEAIDALDAFRSREGAVLHKDVTSRVHTILSLYDEVESLEGERIATVKERLQKNLQDLAAQPDPSRFEQELIFYLEKYDINEEKVRLRQHCRYFLETIEGDPAPGKKLGFIIQEMGREINTTGSKANHAGIQKLVVRMKDELEKIREQSLNIL